MEQAVEERIEVEQPDPDATLEVDEEEVENEGDDVSPEDESDA